MSSKYKNSKRCYLIDHHSPQPPVVTLDQLNIEEYERFFDTAHIDSLMVYCKDHWGVTYYDSKVEGAQKHQGVKTDWIQEVSTVLKKKDIEFIAYYCIEYDEGAARRFPQWRARKPDGPPLIREDEFARWSLCCYQTGYREYCLSQMEEIVQNYRPDALFMDIFGSSLCYCEKCREKFLTAYGYALPSDPDTIRLHMSDIVNFLDENSREFLLDVKQRLKAVDPGLAITVNFSCHYPKAVRDLLDYQFSEPLLKDNWYSSAYARDTAVGQYPILVPGEASQVYNYDTVSQYLCDLSSIAAQGCRVGMYSGSQHADGTLDMEEANRLGTVYTALEEMEPYLTCRTPVKSIGILQSDRSKSVNMQELSSDAILRMKRHNPHLNAILGAMQLCEYAKIPYNILPEGSLTNSLLNQYDMLLLPEVYVIQPEMVSMLEDYVAAGGCLISSGQTGLWNADSTLREQSSLHRLLGCGPAKIHREFASNRWSAYLRPALSHSFTGLLSCTTPPVSEYFMETAPLENSNGTEADSPVSEMLYFDLPCVACDFDHWVNWWSPPPGKQTNYPALLHRHFKKGHVFYLAFDFFTMAGTEKYNYTNDLFADLLAKSSIHPPLRHRTDTPDMIRTAFFETETAYIIHQISMLPKRFHGDTPPIPAGEILFQNPVASAKLVYPEQQSLALSENGTCAALPPLTLQQIIWCEKK